MANAKMCDCCKRFYFYNDLDDSCCESFRGIPMLRFEVTDAAYKPHRVVDFCPNCYKELYKFLTGKEFYKECKSENDSKQ